MNKGTEVSGDLSSVEGGKDTYMRGRGRTCTHIRYINTWEIIIKTNVVNLCGGQNRRKKAHTWTGRHSLVDPPTGQHALIVLVVEDVGCVVPCIHHHLRECIGYIEGLYRGDVRGDMRRYTVYRRYTYQRR